MPDIKGMLVGTVHKLSKNSPAILTAFAVAGVATTAVLAVKATPRAIEILENEAKERRKEDPEFEREFFTPVEKVRLTWLCYAPAAAMGLATGACIIGVNSIQTRRNAALASVYSLTETALKEYQEKVVEHIGVKEERKVRDKVAESDVARNPVNYKEIFITGNGDMLCYDTLTGRYFQSNVEALKRAENLLNADIISNMYASQNDFFEAIGLPRIPYGEESGWKVGHMVDLDFTAMMSEEDSPKPCLAVNHRNLPQPEYYKGF